MSRCRSPLLIILSFHRVLPEPDPYCSDFVTCSNFERQMALLARLFDVVPLADGVNAMANDDSSRLRVALTIDDGYSDAAEHAAPILADFGLPATVFVASGFVGGGVMWNDCIVETLRAVVGRQLDLRPVGFGVEPIGSLAERIDLKFRLIRAWKHLPATERDELVGRLVSIAGVRWPKGLMMDAGQLAQLHGHGVEVGAHTVNHPILRVLDDAAASREIVKSRAELEGLIGQRVRSFAYPNGKAGSDYGARDARLVAEAGFECAVTTEYGASGPGSDRFQLPRMSVWRGSRLGLLAQFARSVWIDREAVPAA
ncbi:MAG: polysaccharide deacetylase family protein [Chromatiales bacterium]|nr:polysaccharide deacetylase family protein [Chromatiales bacterium]